MRVFIVALFVYGLALLGLSIGRLFGRAGLDGSCARDCAACPRRNKET
ncbi:MAG: hypothetical protein OER88_07890 [Planctomycetota bacterium]|nr:hypothetical protein [Planctomycetota bacterium]